MRIDLLRPILAHAASAVLIGMASSLSGCAEVATVTDAVRKPPVALPIVVRVEPCIDRTATAGRELGAQATQAFTDKLGATKEFVVRQEARFRLACDVTSFVEGSAVKRWILPGWGATVGQVSGMLTDAVTGETLVIARGNATVAGGGLYSIGADTYIVPAAVDDVVLQLCAWARGEAPGGASAAGEGAKGRSGQ